MKPLRKDEANSHSHDFPILLFAHNQPILNNHSNKIIKSPRPLCFYQPLPLQPILNLKLCCFPTVVVVLLIYALWLLALPPVLSIYLCSQGNKIVYQWNGNRHSPILAVCYTSCPTLTSDHWSSHLPRIYFLLLSFASVNSRQIPHPIQLLPLVSIPHFHRTFWLFLSFCLGMTRLVYFALFFCRFSMSVLEEQLYSVRSCGVILAVRRICLDLLISRALQLLIDCPIALLRYHSFSLTSTWDHIAQNYHSDLINTWHNLICFSLRPALGIFGFLHAWLGG